MKKFIGILVGVVLMSLVGGDAVGQNLVPNGSFEVMILAHTHIANFNLQHLGFNLVFIMVTQMADIMQIHVLLLIMLEFQGILMDTRYQEQEKDMLL